MKSINRLFEYLKYKGIKHTRFEKELGLSNGYLGTQLKRNADMGESIVAKIVDYCTDLNLEWLLTGKGDMVKSYNNASGSFDKSNIQQGSNISFGCDPSLNESCSKIFQTTIQKQQEQIDKLLIIIDKLSNK